ncbi:COG1470 family protein [Streptomyces sp. NBC_00443]|uniref:COG1470 family protein n=1 Tax=Streptomyces sp. NBC_00443 TaxID=2975743 RepID=UPI002E2313A0
MSSAVRVLCLSLLLLLAAAPAATAAEAWTVAPSGGGRPSFYAEGAPGTVQQDTVSVTNRGGEPVTVRLHGAGVPIAFADSAVRIPARTRAEVPFTVTVPPGTAPGDRSGEIVARDADGRAQTVPLRLRVTGPELSALTVERVRVHPDGITYELVNRGTTALAPSLAIRADGVFGRLLDRAPRPLSVDLPPGSRTKLTEPWPDRPALDAVDVRLTVTAAGGANDTARASALFVPWDAVAGAGGFVVAAVGALLVVRHRGRRRPGGGESAETEQPYKQAELTGVGT